jgi:hypothetical protein
LLLDEHSSPEIARQLRRRGHDVVTVKERPDLEGLRDEGLFARMASERRAIVTNNVKDFMRLADRAATTGEEHYGVLFTSDKSMPRRKDAIGRFLSVLDGLLTETSEEDAYRNRVRWLS